MTLTQRINGLARRVPTWPVYLIGGAVPVWYFYLGVTGGLGADPVKAMEHALGLLSLQVLVAVLAITPIRDHLGLNLVKFRRALGLLVFYFVLCHFLVWFFLDVQFVAEVWNDIVKRPYITIGMAGLVLMVPLAVTSNNLSIRKMGPLVWRRLHKVTYGVAILGGVHFVMASKTWAVEPMVYLGVILGLLALRIKWPRRAGAAIS
ncbi:MAG: protein-methionine-sulfoxide reductase heme-binding subunit MsrQ [Pseudomonadota bacterium]